MYESKKCVGKAKKGNKESYEMAPKKKRKIKIMIGIDLTRQPL